MSSRKITVVKKEFPKQPKYDFTRSEDSDEEGEREVVERKKPPPRREERVRDISELDITPETGRVLCVGETGSGKSTIIRHLIKNLYKSEKIHATYWFGLSHYDEKWIPEKRRADTLSEERIAKLIEMQSNPAFKDLYIIVVLDDVSGIKTHGNKSFDGFISQASRHHRIICLVGVQRTTMISPVFRTNISKWFVCSPSNELVSMMHKESMEPDFNLFRRKFLGVEKGKPLFIDRSAKVIEKVRVPKLDKL